MREKLIELLWDAFELVDNELPTVEQVADHLIAHGVTVQKWISVNERLPSEKKVIDGETYFKNVAVWVKHLEHEQIAFYDDDAEWWFWAENFLPVMGEVTHWMPLPEPPTADMRGE